MQEVVVLMDTEDSWVHKLMNPVELYVTKDS